MDCGGGGDADSLTKDGGAARRKSRLTGETASEAAAESADAADAAAVEADAVEAACLRAKNELAEMTTNSSPEIEPEYFWILVLSCLQSWLVL